MKSAALTLLIAFAAQAQQPDIPTVTAWRPDETLTIQTEKTLERSAVQQQSLELIAPELIVGGEWTTVLRLTNRGTEVMNGTAAIVDDKGALMTVTFQQPSGNTLTGSGLSFRLNPAGGVLEGTFVGGDATRFGHLIVSASTCAPTSGCRLYGEVILRNRNATRPDFESVFPFEQAAPLQYMLYDHRGGFSTVLYLINNNSTPTSVTLEFRDTAAVLVRTVEVAAMAAGSSQILTLHAMAPETLNTGGILTIRATNSAGTIGLVTATALRINPSNSFTPIRAFVPRP